MKNKFLAPLDFFPVDHNVTVIVDVPREVKATMTSIVESLLSLFSIPWLDRRSDKRFIRIKADPVGFTRAFMTLVTNWRFRLQIKDWRLWKPPLKILKLSVITCSEG